MKLKNIQVPGKVFLDGEQVSGVISVGNNGVTEIAPAVFKDGDFTTHAVRVSLASGNVMCFPLSTVILTMELEPGETVPTMATDGAQTTLESPVVPEVISEHAPVDAPVEVQPIEHEALS